MIIYSAYSLTMSAHPLDPTPTEQNYDEDNHHEDEQQATRSVAVLMIPKAWPRPDAPKQEKDNQDNQQ
jgi:hypothetical protein